MTKNRFFFRQNDGVKIGLKFGKEVRLAERGIIEYSQGIIPKMGQFFSEVNYTK